MRNLKSGLRFSTKYNKRISPQTSANTKKPFIVFGLFVILFILSAFWNLENFSYCFIVLFNIMLILNFIFKALFILIYYINNRQAVINEIDKFPIYTILLPCFQEEVKTLQNLIIAISNLNYPPEKLDVKFLLEENDTKTINNLKDLSHSFEVLIVPLSFPQTKPKACNLGLYFAKGEYVVIYDAEDIPDSDQLLSALSKFQKSDKSVMCVQSLLNTYNSNYNFISKCFSLEYLVWFNAFLPSFIKSGMWIPLGGTSNHFKTKELIKIGGWDAYNVTEDAELGIRIAKNGYKSDLIYSYTWEESTTRITDFIFQRSRWLKGFLITFLINILDFKNTLRLGFLNFIQVLFSLGMAFFGFFCIPFLIFFSFFINHDSFLNYLYITNLLCSIIYLFAFCLVPIKEKFGSYNKVYLFLPLYFLLHIGASFVAFWDFFKKPFNWRKTKHLVDKCIL